MYAKPLGKIFQPRNMILDKTEINVTECHKLWTVIKQD